MSELTLNDLPFIDVYVRLDKPDRALYRSKERGQSGINQLVPEEYQLMIDRFSAAVAAQLGTHNDGAIDFEGVRCRLSKQQLNDDSFWVCARRINTVIPDIEKLNITPSICNHMLGLGKRDGLILVSGATGAGKTTTAVALLAYFLRNYGGAAVTIEDPCEFNLRGRHGDGGHCFQVEIKQEDEWALTLKRALRWAPKYIYVGEIRTPKAAEQLLRAASTGHLVITTVHAGSPEEALMGLVFLAEQAMGPGVENILAGSLTGLVYQTMKEGIPQIKYLYTEPDSPGDAVRSLIRDKKIGMLSTYVDRTAARLANGGVTSSQQAAMANSLTKQFGAPGAPTPGAPPTNGAMKPAAAPPPNGAAKPPGAPLGSKLPPPVNPVPIGSKLPPPVTTATKK